MRTTPLNILFLTVVICLNNTFLFSQYKEKSVLAEGDWYKLGITKSGVYKLDYSFLRKMGLLKGGIDPRNIKIYGNGGAMLPQGNNVNRPDDLIENSILIRGEDDGQFNKGDYVLFYAQGPHIPFYNSTEQTIRVTQNIYSDTSYYFITSSNDRGRRISQAVLSEGGTEVTSFNDYIHHELDNINILSTTIMESTESGSGREWYGEDFDFTPNIKFNVNLSGILNSSQVKLFSSVLGCSTSPSSFSVKLNNETIGLQPFNGTVKGIYNSKGEKSEMLFTFTPSVADASNAVIEYSYDKKANAGAKGFLNFYTLNFTRTLRIYNSQNNFRSFQSLENTVTKFTVSGVIKTTRIWDVTNHSNPESMGFSHSAENAEFSVTTDRLREFVGFHEDKLEAPLSFGKVKNQNLHGLDLVDMIIVTYPDFLENAENLAEFRRIHDQLSAIVVTTREIYNEFSSGKQDISAIRDFLRLQFIKGQGKLKYVLLFGDCSFDFKNRVKNNTNFVPVYESRESLHPIYSYSSDDFYGFMEENEGEWKENDEGDHTLDIAVGRIPCKNKDEAHYTVQKIIYYSSNKNNLGNWRNRISFVADDGDANTHLNDADRLTVRLDTSIQNLNVKKIYLDAFPQESVPNVTSIQTKEAINKTVALGTLILNYTGHGGETGWANEKILETGDIRNWKNKERLPLIVTATCEFGKYDDPRQVSAAEVAILNPRGGAIALVTTTRPVFSSTNYVLNKAFYEAAFTANNGKMPTLGEIMMYTKNKSLNGSINRNFALLGDPSLTLAYPKNTVHIQEINNIQIEEFKDTLRALNSVSLKGIINNEVGQMANFDGVLQITIFDKPTTVTTLGNDNPVAKYNTRETIIFKGNFSVKGGAFNFTFSLPKNINYKYGLGKISLYAYDARSLEDATGCLQNVIIGGSSSDITPDNTPPLVTAYINDSTFKSDDFVHMNSILKAKVSDDSGINISSTIVGQDLKASLFHDGTNKEIILNDYFEPDLDNYKSGEITYPFSDLKPGKYSLTIKVWDTYNNSNQTSVNFIVSENKLINISKFYNFPNPFSYSTSTTFSYVHDRAGEDLEAKIDIFDTRGRRINTLRQLVYKSEEQNSDIKWDGTDESGNKIPDGLYVYRLEIRSLSDKNKSYRSEKLLLIN